MPDFYPSTTNISDIILQPGGIAQWLDEVNYLGYQSFPNYYYSPVYFKTLQPEENAFLTIDKSGNVEIRNSETLNLERYFSIGDHNGIFFEHRFLYVLKLNILRKPIGNEGGFLQLLKFSCEGILVENYTSDKLDNINCYQGVQKIVVGSGLLICCKSYGKSDYKSIHFEIDEKAQKISPNYE